jgi:hypothetical protein
MSDSTTVIVTLRVVDGTLYAVPNAGHVRGPCGSKIQFNAAFPFSVEFTQLTGAPVAPEVCESGNSFIVTLPTVPLEPTDSEAPSYKYTIKGGPGGAAAGKVLDPIIIVDKKPH